MGIIMKSQRKCLIPNGPSRSGIGQNGLRNSGKRISGCDVMDLTINLNTILQGVIILLIVAGFKGGLGWLRSIDKKLSEQNSRLTKMEEWRIEHEKYADERINQIRKNVDAIWGRIGDKE